MSEPTQEEVISIVSSQFQVTNVDLTLDTLKFRIEDREFKTGFVELAQRLESRDLICRMAKTSEGTYVLVNRFPPRKQRKLLPGSWLPRILFAIVIPRRTTQIALSVPSLLWMSLQLNKGRVIWLLAPRYIPSEGPHNDRSSGTLAALLLSQQVEIDDRCCFY